MKKICFKGFLCLFVVLVIIVGIDLCTYNSKISYGLAKVLKYDDFLDSYTGTGIEDIQRYIDGVRTDNTEVLVLGDSISRQLFSFLPSVVDETSIQCSNAAVNVTGQYMLAMEYLKYHEDVKEIYIYLHPMALARSFNTELGFSHGVAPFAYNDMMHYLDDETLDTMAKMFGHPFLTKKGIEFLLGSPLNKKIYLSLLEMYKKEIVPDNQYYYGEKYIADLYKTCEEKGISLYLLPSPSSEYYREKIEESRGDYNNTKLCELFPDYLDNVYYFPTEWTEDFTHLGGEYDSEETFKFILNEMESPLNRLFEK